MLTRGRAALNSAASPAASPTQESVDIEDVLTQLRTLTAKLRRLEENESNSANIRSAEARPTKPPTFDGSSNVRTWTWQVNTYFKALRIDSDQRRMDIADTCLRDDAAMWRRMQATPILTWDEWEAGITRRFAPVNEASQARDTIAQLTQKSSVKLYAYQFQQAALILSDLSQEELVYKFTKGLKVDVQLHVKLHRPQTLEEAIRIAYEVDSTVFQLLGKRRQVGAASTSNSPYKAQKTTRDSQRSKLTDEERAYLRMNNGCFYCRKVNVPDHIPNCPDAPPKRVTFTKNGQTGYSL